MQTEYSVVEIDAVRGELREAASACVVVCCGGGNFCRKDAVWRLRHDDVCVGCGGNARHRAVTGLSGRPIAARGGDGGASRGMNAHGERNAVDDASFPAFEPKRCLLVTGNLVVTIASRGAEVVLEHGVGTNWAHAVCGKHEVTGIGVVLDDAIGDGLGKSCNACKADGKQQKEITLHDDCKGTCKIINRAK